MSWIELGEWIEGLSIWGERRFIEALIDRAGFRFAVEPDGAKSRVRVSAYAAGRGIVALFVCAFWRLRFSIVLRRYVDDIERTLAPFAARSSDDVPIPLAAHASRLLSGSNGAAVAAGSSTLREDSFTAAAARFAKAPVGDQLRSQMLVRANGRVDLFGTTVNVASRLQHAADPDRIVVAAELLEHEGVRGALERRAASTRTFSARLRGVRAEHTLVAIAAPPDPSDAGRGHSPTDV
jgi:hypothetical protein